MDIKTKFSVGDNVFTVDTKTIKLKKFEVGRIAVSVTEGKTIVILYEKDASAYDSGYSEDKCFATEGDLVRHLTDAPCPA